MQERIPVSSTLDEETARAEVYGLLAALYYTPPAPELLSQLRVAATEAPAAGAFCPDHRSIPRRRNQRSTSHQPAVRRLRIARRRASSSRRCSQTQP